MASNIFLDSRPVVYGFHSGVIDPNIPFNIFSAAPNCFEIKDNGVDCNGRVPLGINIKRK